MSFGGPNAAHFQNQSSLVSLTGNSMTTTSAVSSNMSREGDDNPPTKRLKREFDPDKVHTEPSKVVHIRNLSQRANEADIIEALQKFGTVAYAVVIPHKRQGLAEFEDLTDAKRCVDYSRTNDIYIAGTPSLYNFSTSNTIKRFAFESNVENKVLCLTIYNVQYPINVDVVHKVCNQYGQVLRICMIRRSGTQALVEFDSVASAKACKRAINGADIYQRCCSIKAEFAKTDQVNVSRHDSEQWDYTVKAESGLPQEMKDAYVRKTLLPNANPPLPQPQTMPGAGGMPPQYAQQQTPQPTSAIYAGVAPPMPQHSPYPQAAPPMQQAGGYGAMSNSRPPTAHDRLGPAPMVEQPFGMNAYASPGGMTDASMNSMQHGGGIGYGASYESQANGSGLAGCVVMMYGVDQSRLNCDGVFNLLCMYGNVLRVKFMKTKRDTVMAEMARPEEAQFVIDNLSGVHLFGQQLAFRASKQNSLHAKGDPFNLPDGSPSFKEYAGSKYQRFDTQESARRNRITRPTKVLHWYNAPTDVTEEKLKEVFVKANAPVPTLIKIFNTRSERSSSGVMEFASVTDATDAIVLANHSPLDSSSSRNPYIVKMAFSTSNN